MNLKSLPLDNTCPGTLPEMMKPMEPWYWRSLPLENRTGSQIFNTLFRSTNFSNIATLLESPFPAPPDSHHLTRYSICAGSPRIVNHRHLLWTPPVGKILPFLQQLLDRSTVQATPKTVPLQSNGHFQTHHPNNLPPSLPFTGGWLGWLGYDLAWEIEHLPKLKSDPLPFPVAYWYEPAEFAVLDHQEQTLWLAATEPSTLDLMQKQVEESLERQDSTVTEERVTGENQQKIPFLPHNFLKPIFHQSSADYEEAVIRAKKYIQAGDIFQANLSLRFEAATTADSWSIYRALQQINPSPFASYWQTPWGAVISCSPERLVHLQNRQAQTRPIAGTRSRGATPELDQSQEQDLIINLKERAEHIMLVDLERNDLGRVCQWGSVQVDELLTIERYSHVMHLVSNVTGILHRDHNSIDLIRAMFPGGTITGCPKVRCMEIIEQLEPVRRNLFYGSCGYLDWRGNLDLNILIRTLLFTQREIEQTSLRVRTLDSCSSSHPYDTISIVFGQVGAGIVADSDPDKEWQESLHKAQAQLTALQLVLSTQNG